MRVTYFAAWLAVAADPRDGVAGSGAKAGGGTRRFEAA
jgi:hypothetical protein